MANRKRTIANTTKYNLGGTRKEKTMMKEIIEKIRTSLDPSVTRPSVMAPTYSRYILVIPNGPYSHPFGTSMLGTYEMMDGKERDGKPVWAKMFVNNRRNLFFIRFCRKWGWTFGVSIRGQNCFAFKDGSKNSISPENAPNGMWKVGVGISVWFNTMGIWNKVQSISVTGVDGYLDSTSTIR